MGERAISLHTDQKLIEHDFKLERLNERIDHIDDVCSEMRGDIKLLLQQVVASQERDRMYDKLVRIIPVAITLLSCLYWTFSHLNK